MREEGFRNEEGNGFFMFNIEGRIEFVLRGYSVLEVGDFCRVLGFCFFFRKVFLG